MSYNSTDKLQCQAGCIKREKYKHAYPEQDLLNWISKTFKVSTLDFLCEKRENQKSAPQQLVHLVLETADDIKKIQTNRTEAALISELFLNYFTSQRTETTDPLKKDVFSPDTIPYPEIIITYRPLKELNEDMLKEMLADEKLIALTTFEHTWTISQQMIFYMTDAQVKENQANGTSAKIIEQLKLIDSKYDYKQPYDYSFDSKESFDRDYDSNWYYYWK